jgi:hypothetical protein
VVATAITLALSLGVLLSLILGGTMHLLPLLFTQDPAVRQLAQQLMPIVAFTQPLNALAFVMDGVLYGAGGFKYASGVMLLCATPSLALMFAGQVYAVKPKPQPSGQNWMNNAAPEGLLTTWQQQQQQMLLSPYVGAASVTATQHGQGSMDGFLQGFAVASQQSQLGYSSVSQLYWLTSSSSYAATVLPGHAHSYPYTTATAPASMPFEPTAVPGSSSSSRSGDLTLGLQYTVQMPAAVYWVWAGMVVLMFMRAATILLPLACRQETVYIIMCHFPHKHT